MKVFQIRLWPGCDQLEFRIFGTGRGRESVCTLKALDGGHDRDRTCDPYHVKVVLSR
jgi:hypothetical protein